ncbi:MAG: hypothetical protein AAF937_00890 [Planctomycetota bacterium]
MWKMLCGGFLAALVVGLFLIVPRWQQTREEYSHATPDELIASFATMIESGDVGRIPELVWAEGEPMRGALAQMGALFREMRLLGLAVNEAFPAEVERLKRETEAAAARGEATDLLGRLGRSVVPGQRNRGQRSDGARGDGLNVTFRALLASPYDALEDARDRLSVLEINEGLGGLMWDGQMVLPPFGLSVKQDLSAGGTGDWYIVLPLDLPFVSKYRPRTEEQWFIAGKLLQAWTNAAVDLRGGIESGAIRSLSEATSELGATVGVPTAMIAVAYSKQFEDGGN